MVAPVIAAAGISALGSIAGGLFGNRSAAKQVKYQKEFAQKGIQWRVADAKAAGLHPLYALGAQTAQYSPVSSPLGESLSEAGQNIGRAVAAQLTPAQLQAQNLALQQSAAELRKTIKEGDYLDAEMARIRSDRLRAINEQISEPIPEFNVKEGGSAGTVFGGQAIRATDGVPAGFITPQAPVSYSPSVKDPGIAAGNTPMMREFKLPGGLPILLPGGMQGDPSEALESLSESPFLMWSVYKINREKYGPEWASQFRARYMWGDTFEKWWKWSARNRGKPASPRTHRTRQDFR